MYYLTDTQTHSNHIQTRSSRIIHINDRIETKKLVKDLPFEEIMELINARHGFFYNEKLKKRNLTDMQEKFLDVLFAEARKSTRRQHVWLATRKIAIAKL